MSTSLRNLSSAFSAFSACAVLLLLAAPAHANDIDLAVSPSVPVGKRPTLTIKVKKDLASGQLELKNNAGGSHRQPLRATDAGKDIVIELPQAKVGKVKWTGTLSVVFADDTQGSMPLTFGTEVLGGFKFSVRDEDIDLENHAITVTSEHDTAKIEVDIITDGGESLAATGKEFGGAKAGTPMKVEWLPKKAGDVLRIDVKVIDTATAFQTASYYPYKLEIPHEDVEFETGKHDVRASEEPKLNAARAEIEKGVKRFADAIKADTGVVVRLFVRGHTDTVGSAAANRALSERRANAIAKWFARSGLRVQIFTSGVGEDMPKVDTPDETENQQNRRVEYIVSTEPASTSNPGWTRVN